MWQLFYSPEEVLNKTSSEEATDEEYVFKRPNCGVKYKKV